MEPKSSDPNTKKSVNLSFDYRYLVALLIVIIGIMLLLWKPWSPKMDENARTIEVTGTAKVTAAPDEFIFYPGYEFKNASEAVSLADLTKKSEEVIAKLKELGVADSKIKTNADGNNFPFHMQDDSQFRIYMLQLTVTVNDKDLAQKVQDYLLTTTPTGSVSPQATFSDAKRKELETKARDDATREARSKAEQSAKNLGFKLGAVKSVNDGAGFGGIVPLRGNAEMDASDSSKLTLQPGENDLNYGVSVTYFVK